MSRGDVPRPRTYPWYKYYMHVVKVVLIVGTVYTGARRIDAGAPDQLQTRLGSSGVALDLDSANSLP